MKFLGELEKSKNFWFLLITSLFFFILRLPSLFEPYWYGDEGVYQVLGLAIRNGRLLYKDIWDNKPPLLYSLYALFNSDQFLIRLVSLIFGIATVIVFFLLAKKIFNKNRTSIIVTSFFALLFSLPILEGNIANAENFMLLPIVSSALILTHVNGSILQRSQNKNLLLISLSGLMLGIAFLFKIVAVFDFAAFSLFILFMDDRLLEHLKHKKYFAFEVKKLTYFVAAFSSLPLLIFLFFFLKGALPDFLRATLFSNVGYVGYGNTLIIPQGLLILKLLILSAFVFYIYKKRESLGVGNVLILLWFSFSLFDAFFSQRPYTHYLLMLLSSFCLLLGALIESTRYKLFFASLSLISFLLVLLNFNFYTKTFYYYGNFLSFETGKETVKSYQTFFDKMTPIDYELALYIKTNLKTKDNIYIWGNNAQLYKLTDKLPPGKYTVAYHVMGMKGGIEETIKALSIKRPKLIIIMPYMDSVPFSLMDYSKKTMISGVSVYERIF